MQESIVCLVRVQCRRKESSRSLSHLLMSFLLLWYWLAYTLQCSIAWLRILPGNGLTDSTFSGSVIPACKNTERMRRSFDIVQDFLLYRFTLVFKIREAFLRLYNYVAKKVHVRYLIS